MVDDGPHIDLATLLEDRAGARERARLERHLLVCDTCWEAVREDRQGRLLAEDLCEAAPAALRDRISLITEGYRTPVRRRLRRPPRRGRNLATVAAVTAMAVLAIGVLVLRPLPSGPGGGPYGRGVPGRSGDPLIISEVAAFAGSPAADKAIPAVVIAPGQTTSLTTTTSQGSTVIVPRGRL